MSLAPADALVAALIDGKSLVEAESIITHREEPLTVYLDKWANGKGCSLRLSGWGSAVMTEKAVALSIIESPEVWRIK